MTRIQALLATLTGLFFLLSFGSVWAGEGPDDDRKSTSGKMSTGGKLSTGGSTKTSTTKKTTSTKRTPTKKKRTTTKKKATPKQEPLPYGAGPRVGVMPYNSMESFTTGKGKKEYDMSLAYGIGLAGHYRLLPNLYAVGELMYWYTEVDGIEEDGTDKGYTAKESDGLFNLGIGLRYNVLGSERSSDRVYVRGIFGLSSYIADDSNLEEGDNRTGLYYGFGVGIEHELSRVISAFADASLNWNNFTSPASGESEAEFFNWQVGAGLLIHWR